MTQFEYLAIAFSLLYSLAALRLIGGLPSALVTGIRSFRHLVLSGTTLFLVAVSFWVFYSLNGVVWTFGGFLVSLLIPATLYYLAATLIPPDAASVPDWEEWYIGARKRWYAGMAVWGLSAAASATLNLGMGLAHPARGVQATAIAVGLIGATARREQVHWAFSILFVLLIAATLALQVPMGWLAEP